MTVPPSDRWSYKGRFHKVSWRLNVIRHHYLDGSRRWVIQPTIRWDVR